jgi:hypothetical protein
VSATSEFNANQYYTSDSEAETLLTLANELWGLERGTLLEPSVGAGAFPKAAARLGLAVEWRTNELYPDASNYQPDTCRDFLDLTPFAVDAVVGNPPYTGWAEVGGQKLPLYECFVHQALRFSDRVAFVLPLPVLKWRTLARLPKGVELVGWTEPKRNGYLLGGYGTNEEQEVATTLAFFERTGGPGVEWNGTAPEGLEWLPDGHSDATHAVCNWGRAGSARCLRGSWGATLPAASELHCRVTSTEVEALLATNAINEFYKKLSSASPSVSREEINHSLRIMLDRQELGTD